MLFVSIPATRWCAFLLLGFTLFMQAGNAVIDARLQTKFAGDSLLTEVRIADFPRVRGASVSMIIEPVDDARIPTRARVTWFDPPTMPAIGEIWELELRLRRPRGNSNPGVFSVENWMFREKLPAAGYVVAGDRNHRLPAEVLSPLESYRRNFVDRTKKISGDSAASVLVAIGVGSRHLITREQWDRYAKTGSSHLMAISGLHVGLAAAAAFFAITAFSAACRLPGNYLDYATIGAAVMAAAYALISGFAVPSQRATIMLGWAAIAFLCRRRVQPGRIVAGVALLVYVLDPIALMMPGFVLSFGAVLVLLWFARRYWRPHAGLRLLQLATMQCVLLFGLTPLTVLIFQRIAVVAPLVNLITVPVFSLVTVPMTLASMVLHPLWDAGSIFLLRVSASSIRGLEWVIAQFSSLPVAGVLIPGIDGFGGAILCIALLPALWIILPRGWPGRWVAVLAAVALLLNKPATPNPGCIDVHVLDVGQGLAVVVQSAGHTLVFDTGASFRGGGSVAAQLIVPFLRFKGIDLIDWLVVSHADNDHAGGVAPLIKQVEVAHILSGEALPDIGRDVFSCALGQIWRADGIEYRFLHPEPESVLAGNDASCVLLISAGEYRLLLTGDIEAAGERNVLRHLSFEAVSVVVIPHHGSLTSSSPAFVHRLRPQLAIASAGYENRWGFPKQDVTKRWEGTGAVVRNTASSGAISVRLCEQGGVGRLREERVRQQRFWHDSAAL